MAIRKVALPYAKALLQVAIAQNVLEKVRDELTDFAWNVRRFDDLKIVISNPTISQEDRRVVVNKIASKMRISLLTKNFLNLLIDKGRITHIVDITEIFCALADKEAGIVKAVVESATELTLQQQTNLKSALERRTQKRILLHTKINPSLIAGICVRVEGKLYDGSVKKHLENLREAILSEL